MDHLPTEQSQRSYLLKLRYKITDEMLAQTNLALETMPMANITETSALIYATVTDYRKVWGKMVSTPNASQCLAATAGEEDQAIEIRCQETQ